MASSIAKLNKGLTIEDRKHINTFIQDGSILVYQDGIIFKVEGNVDQTGRR